MCSVLPLCVSGQTLGARHCHLNRSVTAAEIDKLPFSSIQHLPEETPIDRLFKIQLASRLKNVEYIIAQLQQDDLLYVCSALRATWLLQHEDVIDPKNLEEVLYPKMTLPAVHKLRHWLYINLRDPIRCQYFYQFYRERDFHYAFKFLWRCSNNFILDEAPKILESLTPRYLKLLCEQCPGVAKLFYDSIATNRNVKKMYLKNEKQYYDSIKTVLKSEADVFLDITEKYFNFQCFQQLSRIATSYIMTHQRTRFDKKPELYAMRLLDMKTLALKLNSAECEELIVKLARAKYLQHLFSYKAVEPLIKRLDKDSRTVLRKKVFVEKDVGEIVNDWPYATPEQLTKTNRDVGIFEDREYYLPVPQFQKMKLTKRSMKCGYYAECCVAKSLCRVYTLLDKLYDEFRFYNFERTFFELKKRLKAQSSAQDREYMMLVLVSKAGGREESVETLLKYLNEHHSNESVQIRAAVVRSIMKRARGWRLSAEGWEQLLALSRGLGLDGTQAEAPCIEGLHAAVLRHLLEPSDCPSQLQKAFLESFSTFKEYSLSDDEKKRVIHRLPQLLLKAIDSGSDPDVIAQRFYNILDTLSTYKLREDKCDGLVPALSKFAEVHPSVATNILQRLFRERMARRQLFRENFALVQTDASYVNALRHGTDVLRNELLLESMIKKKLKPEQFLRKLSIYFSESNGLASRILSALNAGATEISKPNNVGRAIVYLSGTKLESTLKVLGTVAKKSPEARLAGAMKANLHVARPSLDIEVFGWKNVGGKAVVNRMVVTRARDVDQAAVKLASWRRTARAALAMTARATNHYEIFSTVATVRPKAIVHVAVSYFQRHYRGDPRIWNIFESALQNIDLSENKQLRQSLLKFKSMPDEIKAKYCTVLYESIKGVKCPIELSNDKVFEHKILLTVIVNLIPIMEETFVEGVIIDFLNSGAENDAINEIDNDGILSLYIAMIARYILLCKSENAQRAKLKNIGEPFFSKVVKISTSSNVMADILNKFLSSLKYMKVFLNSEYVSCLPVMERVVAWMKDILPVEVGFQKYVNLHITMLLFKTIRQCIGLTPEVFKEARIQEEGVCLVARVLGKYIAQEVAELTDKYFDSVIELYQAALIYYFDEIEWGFHYAKGKFVTPLVIGMLEDGKGNGGRLPVHIMKWVRYDIDDKMKGELLSVLKEKGNEECEFLVRALDIFECESYEPF